MNPALLRPSKAAAYAGVGKTKLYDLLKNDPTFPEPIRLSNRCVGWLPKQLDEWLESKLSEASKPVVQQGGRL